MWRRLAGVTRQAWASFAAGGALEAFVDALDAGLCAGEPTDTLCLSAGRWSLDGALQVATCGYGVHALVHTTDGPSWGPAEALFGLKLGWFGPARRRELPRGLVVRSLTGVRRLALLSDGLLPDDHRDPVGTLAALEGLQRRLGEGSFEAALPALFALAPDPREDDATALVLEPA
ncbi:MAG: hypothetical protein R3F62_15195 [Planctomycetota bacterium]